MKSRYQLWGPQDDSYGVKRWGINDAQRVPGAGSYNISGQGHETRQQATHELHTLRAEERAAKREATETAQ